ncbi:heterodisulfide reductase-related iron-sulfur binding cluster [Thiocystis violascens]|uniref:Fe-S oxidoreductase n=1 Tax=Thiocystis violascens (strain ATCC 17096 / DSM 198 / 6111) TaxID=765911 RepID=I3YGI0_THIV6|nr:heterodisulfide reductase-related iron-sulfur binding cluster [Thiocystis violascens]AFL76098.1 Fe-S oxidoreductase [Thiocystis violascens DSM 198]
MATPTLREGSLEAPTRHPLDWQNPAFYDEGALFHELERVFDICHGCRRCVSLCQSFPTLFDLVDESESLEVDGVAKDDYWKVVDHCYLCDLCYMTKCPYVPPHEWNLDFPHLMLRAKAVKYRQGKVKFRDRVLTSTDRVGALAGFPVINGLVNAVNANPLGRRVLEAVLDVHRDARVPEYRNRTLRKQEKARIGRTATGEPAGTTTGKVALFATCYGNFNEPGVSQDLIAVFEHSGIPVALAEKERCCGMPKLELGDLESVRAAKEANLPVLRRLVEDGWDIVAPIPSCVLMFKQELPLMFPEDPAVQLVKSRIFDPFEYLMLRHRHGKLNLDFKQPLGSVVYQTSCHQRVQNIGQKTREILALVPGTTVEIVERCSGHDGTYAVKKESYAAAMKIVRPVAGRVDKAAPDYFGSDCPMAGAHIAHALGCDGQQRHPLSLLRLAYGI